MLRFNLFGSGQAHYLDRPLSGFPNQQCYLLFCYLLLNRHTVHSRERLAAFFWPEYSASTSRKYLRNAFWRLRQALQEVGASADDYLFSDGQSIAFIGSSPYWLDVEIFEITLTHYQDLAGGMLTSEQSVQLERAVELYVGDLLDGIYEDWSLHDRERLKALYLNGLSKLMVFHEINGAYERALIFGERVLIYENVREPTHRHMMRLYWRLGDRNAALAQYKRCVQILRDELDVSPASETEQLYRQMLTNQFTPTNGSPDTAPSPVSSAAAKQSKTLIINQALQRLHQLQSNLEEAQNEIQRLELLLNNLLLDEDEA